MVQMNMSRDFEVWDNIESLTYSSTRQTGDLTDTVPHVRRHLIGVKESVASAGAYTAGDVLFYAPRAVWSSGLDEPKPGDIVYDDQDVRWTVITVDHRKRDRRHAQTYKLQCRDLRVAFGLEDLITIETPVRALDSTAARVVDGWTPKYELLPAKVQIVSEAEATERGIRGGKATYTVLVDRQIKVALGEDRIAWYQGRQQSAGQTADPQGSETPVYLDIVGYRNPFSIQELPVIDAEARP